MAITAEEVEGLSNAFLSKRYDDPAPTPDFHREMWRMCCSKSKFVAIAAPRAHAKSTAITHAYTLACVLLRERSFVLIVADTETQSCFFLDDIKKELTTNEDLIKVFGIKGLIKDSVTDIIVEFDDGAQARLIAKGSGQSLRGVKWANKRPDLIICDDLENEELVLNKDRRENFRRWFSGTLLPCRSKDGIIRFVGTILHMDSQLNRLMPRLGRRDRPCYVDEFKELSHPHDVWHSARYRAHNRKMDAALWEEHRSLEWLKTERQAYIDQGHSDLWAQEMLNVPFDEENAPFKRRMFHEAKPEQLEQNFNYYISCDFATTEKQKSDYTVFMVSGVNAEGLVYIIDIIRERMDTLAMADMFMQLCKRYDPHLVFVEKGQVWNMLSPLINNAMMREEEFFLIEELASSTDKRARSATIRARMLAGRVLFNKSADWWLDFEEECLRFTGQGNTHDDMVDALSLLGIALNRFVEAPTPAEEAEELYQEEVRESESFQIGRSEVTGY